MIIVDRGVQRTMSDLVTAVGSKYFCKGVNCLGSPWLRLQRSVRYLLNLEQQGLNALDQELYISQQD